MYLNFLSNLPSFGTLVFVHLTKLKGFLSSAAVKKPSFLMKQPGNRNSNDLASMQLTDVHPILEKKVSVCYLNNATCGKIFFARKQLNYYQTQLYIQRSTVIVYRELQRQSFKDRTSKNSILF